eukprot:scaffold203524_cov17-Tisochrysis_lutea.AAC.1
MAQASRSANLLTCSSSMVQAKYGTTYLLGYAESLPLMHYCFWCGSHVRQQVHIQQDDFSASCSACDPPLLLVGESDVSLAGDV